MATTTLQTPPPTNRTARFLKRAAVAALVLVAILALGAYTWYRNAANSALPQLDGEIKLAGITAPVSVIRDGQGVPHITAGSIEDLMFAQGYVTAQDRLWQMDIQRRYAAGELSEVLGGSTLETDIEQRILGLRQVASRAAAGLNDRDRRYFEAYAHGVNAYIEQHRDSLPLEFRVLRYAPRAWAVEDSFLIGTMMAQMLNHGQFLVDLQREKMLGKLGPELYADLYVNRSFRDIPPGAREDQNLNAEDATDRRGRRGKPVTVAPPSTRHSLSSDSQLTTHDSQPDFIPGSNNWVVSGAHTESGKPLLSNDMHLEHQLPNIWYETHLTAGEFDVAGVTVPGLPFIVVGHNRRIAWGFTNINPDVQDVFIETFNERGEYQTPTGWQKPDVRREQVRIKDGNDTSLEVLTTRHGPIVTELVKNEKRRIALKWALYDSGAMTFPFYEVNAAQNWDEFRAAFAKFGGPGQNAVYADIDGHIGYQSTGRVPLRMAGDGSLPVNGSDDGHEWTGYIAWDKMPRVFDPPDGVIATANGRITPDNYEYSISTEWAGPYRTERIYKLLRSSKKLSPDDMLRIQTDIYSALDKFFAERFVYAIDHKSGASDRLKKAAEILRKWDGRMSIDSSAPTIVTRSRKQLLRMLLEPRVGSDWEDYKWWMSGVFLENTVLLEKEAWLPSKDFGNYEALLAAAVNEALKDAPRDLDSWTWGKVATIQVKHFVFAGIPLLSRVSSTEVLAQSGSGDTVKQVGKRFGPSERLTVDFSDLDRSTLNIVNGQSGHISSKHYNDQWKTWYDGTTYPLPFSKEAVDKAAVNQLTLSPAK